ncbi:MAG: hypothetical protein ACPKM1_15665 [Spirochaetaceae bacterium]
MNSGQDAWIQQDITVAASENHSLTIEISSGTGDMTVNVGTTQGGTDIYSGVFDTANNIVIEDLQSPATTMWIECRVSGPNNPEKIIDTIILENTDTPAGDVEFTSPWTSASEIAFLQAEMVPHELTLRFVGDDVEPYDLTFDLDTDTWALSATSFTSAPAEWVAGSWPCSICFFEGRMYLGGSRNNPNRFWASKSGQDNYTDFTTGALADDALSHDLSRRGKIRWMAGAQNLVIGTENAEWIISSTDGVIIPGDISSRLQSTYGSFQTRALEVGNDLLYITPDGRKIRRMGYEWTKDAWTNQDLTFASEHITEDGNYLTQLHYGPNPANLIASVTGKNEAVKLTYEPNSATGGFVRRTTQGSFLSLCVLSFGGTDEFWILARREDGKLYLERQTSGESRIKMDSHYRVAVNGTPATSVTVPHLAGMTCQCLVDGAVHPDVVPDASTGEVALEFAATEEVVVGLGFDSTLVTMPISDSINPIGTTRPMRKRWSKAFVRVLDSYRPKVNGVRPPDRTVPTPMGEQEDPQTESVPVTQTGWSFDATLTITQDLPLTTEIGGIFGQIDQEEV